MTNKRHRVKNRSESGSFVALPHAMICSEEWAELSAQAIKLLLDLYAQYKGNNNGDLTMAWSIMKSRGWRSKDTLNRARKVLLKSGWIICTRQGGLRIPGLYAVTWKPIDDCGGKLDMESTNKALGTWKTR